ncbi:MAG TPA: TolC family protein [Acidiferrobacter sp.]|nr:TolC family protein [Acidiferrobacter sp.]
MGWFWRTLFAALLVGSTGVAFAQTFTLREAVDFALQHNSTAAIARSKVAAAQDATRAARSQDRPRAAVSYGYLWSNDPLAALSAELERRQVTAADFAPDALNHPGTTRLGTTTLSLSWPLYMGGAIRDAIRAGRFGQKAAQLAAQRTTQRIITNVVQAYEGLVMAKAATEVARKAMMTATHRADTTQHLYIRGRIVHSDALAASVNLGVNKALLAEAQGDVATATENLALAMGAPSGLVIAIPDRSLGPVVLPRKGLADYLNEAQSHRPDIEALRAQARAMRAQARAARAQSSVHVMLTTQSQWFSQTPALRNNAWTVGAVISKSLYDGHHNRDRADVLQEQATQLDEQLAGLRSRIRYSVTVAYENMQTAETRYELARANVIAARHAVALVRVRYGEGRTILLDLLSTDQSLAQAREAKLGALYALAINRAALEGACGTLSVDTLASLGLPS